MQNRETTQYDLNEVCEMGLDRPFMVEGYAPGHPAVPEYEDYSFPVPLLRQFAVFNRFAKPSDGLYLYGPRGSGKTQFVTQLANRLNIPLWTVACGGQFDARSAIGEKGLCDGATVFEPGPMYEGISQQGWILLNEMDAVPPEESLMFNDLGRLFVPETGEHLIPGGLGRFFGSGNTNLTGGDRSGNYAGTQAGNTAWADRWWGVHVDYLPAEREVALLTQAVPGLDEDIAKRLVSVATSIRKLHQPEAGVMGDSFTLSFRALSRWAVASFAYASLGLGTKGVIDAFTLATGWTATADQRKSYADEIRMVFG